MIWKPGSLIRAATLALVVAAHAPQAALAETVDAWVEELRARYGGGAA